jgi:hypothetical protein
VIKILDDRLGHRRTWDLPGPGEVGWIEVWASTSTTAPTKGEVAVTCARPAVEVPAEEAAEDEPESDLMRAFLGGARAYSGEDGGEWTRGDGDTDLDSRAARSFARANSTILGSGPDSVAAGTSGVGAGGVQGV